jgi:3-ketosteroid 9alpha-monooxygenase subunit A
MAENFPHALPNGWFQVGFSDELGPGELKTVHYFGQDLLLARYEDGTPLVADPWCPHLGAHLGHGGRFEDGALRCPFHGWRFGKDGACIDVPYAKRIPPKAALTAWPVVERNGALFAWRHAEGKAPSYEIPVVPQFDEPGWQGPRRHRWTIRAQFQEQLENVVDPAHFRYVHGTASFPDSQITFDGPTIHSLNLARMETPKGVIDGKIEARTVGPGFGFTLYEMGGAMFHTTCSTPVDEQTIEANFTFFVQGETPEDADRGIGAAMIREVHRQMAQDIPIWENKRYLEKPILCDGDGPIPKARAWMQQFYSEAPRA